jgi:long-subunit fatty acid transport protein
VRRHKKKLILTSFLVAIIAAPVLASNGAKLTSYGVRAAGRGGVDYAFADDATAPATNPAGIAYTSNRLDQTWVAAYAMSDFTDSFKTWNSTNWAVAVPAYSFGVVFDPSTSWHVGDLFDLGNWGLRHGANDPPDDEKKDDSLPPPPKPTVPLGGGQGGTAGPGSSSSVGEPSDEELYGGRVHFGFGVFPVTGGTFRYDHITTNFWSPASLTYAGGATELAFAPSVAFRIIGGRDFSLSLGYSPQVHYATFALEGPIEQPNTTLSPNFRFSSIFVGSTSLQTYAISHNMSTYGFSQRFGIKATTPFFSAGLVYQDRTYLQDFLGSSYVDASTQVARLTTNNPALLQVVDPRINPSLGFVSNYGMRIQNFQQPRQIGAGLAFTPGPRFSLGLDYTFIHWAEFFRVFQVRLSNGSNPNLDIMTSPTVKVRVPLEYKDQHVIAVGASVVAIEGDDIVPGVPSFRLILRAGYNWAQQPVPANNAIPQTPIYYEHHVSGGITFEWGPYLDFSAAVEYALPSTVTTGNSITNSDLSNSRQTSSLITMMVGLGVNF